MTDNEEKILTCECHDVHMDVINMVGEQMLDKDTFAEMVELFKAFSDNTRLRILFALSESELCVCDISELLGMSQSAISHQLRVLKSTDLVKFEKRGKQVYYSLDDDHVRRIFKQAFEHVKHKRTGK
ncbi:MAG: winged helix-turn-helix transcriptional regulator [Firmicutes bacterium]|nr:winged helix-turn-helix transcriptional regulator [Bacillota bacterium]